MTPERRRAVVNQRVELRATKTTTIDLGSWMVYMICWWLRVLQLTEERGQHKVVAGHNEKSGAVLSLVWVYRNVKRSEELRLI